MRIPPRSPVALARRRDRAFGLRQPRHEAARRWRRGQRRRRGHGWPGGGGGGGARWRWRWPGRRGRWRLGWQRGQRDRHSRDRQRYRRSRRRWWHAAAPTRHHPQNDAGTGTDAGRRRRWHRCQGRRRRRLPGDVQLRIGITRRDDQHGRPARVSEHRPLGHLHVLRQRRAGDHADVQRHRGQLDERRGRSIPLPGAARRFRPTRRSRSRVAAVPGCSSDLNFALVLNTQTGPVYFTPTFPIRPLTATWKTGMVTLTADAGAA